MSIKIESPTGALLTASQVHTHDQERSLSLALSKTFTSLTTHAFSVSVESRSVGPLMTQAGTLLLQSLIYNELDLRDTHTHACTSNIKCSI